MHELGMCESVLAAVEKRARDRPVARVGVRAGALLRVVPEAFAQSFELVAEGSIADGASTQVTVVGAQCRCAACDTSFESHDVTPACPSCGNVGVSREGGDELILEWIQYRDESDAIASEPIPGA